MKTTLELPDELFRRAKRAALERGTSLKAVVTAVLERELGPVSQDRPPNRTHVCPPPGTVTGTIDSSVVLDAIRRLRDGQVDAIANDLADTPDTSVADDTTDNQAAMGRRKQRRR